jgi:hypothetical protein
VSRFQEDVACLVPGPETSQLHEGARVVALGALEIMAEYRTHMKALAGSSLAAKPVQEAVAGSATLDDSGAGGSRELTPNLEPNP